MTTVRLFRVGGCVRDEMLGVPTHDIDFAVEADSFSTMQRFLDERGFETFVTTPEFLTIRARFPRHDPQHGRLTADFVLCRKDSRSSNHRHPDEVTPGTILDDLERRDFTVNAMAIDEITGDLLDPHGGVIDLQARRLRFVGEPFDRLQEDALRALRAVRFAITKNFTFAPSVADALADPRLPGMLGAVSTERVRDELHKAFRHDTVRTIEVLVDFGLFEPLFSGGRLHLEPTMRTRGR